MLVARSLTLTALSSPAPVDASPAVALALGVFARPAAFALFSTMGLAVAFHIHDSGLEGFPLAVVEAHQYSFETAGLYALAFLYFVCAGPGRFSISGGK